MIQSILWGRDCVALMATGMGKVGGWVLHTTITRGPNTHVTVSTRTHTRTHTPQSLTYQLPSLALREIQGFKATTVVISPLISLMEDQVVGLKSNGQLAAARACVLACARACVCVDRPPLSTRPTLPHPTRQASRPWRSRRRPRASRPKRRCGATTRSCI